MTMGALVVEVPEKESQQPLAGVCQGAGWDDVADLRNADRDLVIHGVSGWNSGVER
jgi:hypothetical protein